MVKRSAPECSAFKLNGILNREGLLHPLSCKCIEKFDRLLLKTDVGP